MKLTPVTLHGDRLECTVRSQSDRRVTHTVYGNVGTGRVWCGPTCKAHGAHGHTHAMAMLLRDLADIRRNQERMSDEMLALQVAWLQPETVGFVSLAWLCAQDLLYSRQRQEVAA